MATDAPFPLIPAQRPIGRQHPMAGHLGRERIAAHRVADGPRAGPEIRGQGRVGGPSAGGDGEEDSVDAAAVGGEGWMEGDAAELFLEGGGDFGVGGGRERVDGW